MKTKCPSCGEEVPRPLFAHEFSCSTCGATLRVENKEARLECARFSGHDSAPASGRHLGRVMPPFEFGRSKVSESRMSSDAIVEHLDVLEYRPLCLFPGGKAS